MAKPPVKPWLDDLRRQHLAAGAIGDPERFRRIWQQLDPEAIQAPSELVALVASTAQSEGEVNQSGHALTVASIVDYARGANEAALKATQRSEEDLVFYELILADGPELFKPLVRAKMLAGSKVEHAIKELAKNLKAPAADAANPIKSLLGGGRP